MNGGGSSDPDCDGGGAGGRDCSGRVGSDWSGGACCARSGDAKIMNAAQAKAIRCMTVSPAQPRRSSLDTALRIGRLFGAATDALSSWAERSHALAIMSAMGGTRTLSRSNYDQ